MFRLRSKEDALFHIAIHARPQQAQPHGTVQIDGKPFTALHVPQAALAAPFPVTFEQAGDALSQIARLYFEPDGAFVWRADATAADGSHPAWQLDGVLYDRDSRLLYLEVNGTCPPAEFDQLLEACSWPRTAVIFQLLRHAVFLDEPEFRRWAFGPLQAHHSPLPAPW